MLEFIVGDCIDSKPLVARFLLEKKKNPELNEKEYLKKHLRKIKYFGNRFTLLAEILIVLGVTQQVTAIMNHTHSMNLELCPGTTLCGLTEVGEGTVKSYINTLEHILKNGEISGEFFIRESRLTKQKKIYVFGYCQLQGIYLAAKEMGPEHVERFFELKRRCTQNIVPNF